MLTPRLTELVEHTVSHIRDSLERGESPAVASSFQTQSLPLLHILSTLDTKIKVFFIDTGFQFPETLRFQAHIVSLLELDCETLRPAVAKVSQRDTDLNFLFLSQPDRCCSINKVEPLWDGLGSHSPLISGVRRDQSATRNLFSVRMKDPQGVERLHPMLDWTHKDILDYVEEFRLPEHPLEVEGYQSVGCAPCTNRVEVKDLNGVSRAGRWEGFTKTECGLHLALSEKSSA